MTPVPSADYPPQTTPEYETRRSRSSVVYANEESPPSLPVIAPVALNTMSHKDRGEFYLAKNMCVEAVEAFTNAIKENEQSSTYHLASSLKDLGRAILKKRDLPLAAKIFNAALSVCVKQPLSNEATKRTIINYMVEVERSYLEYECGLSKKQSLTINSEIYFANRLELQRFRQIIRSQVEAKESSSTILAVYSKNIISLIERLIHHGKKLFGEPKCTFAFLGLGSLARFEMSPYSDLEFALLVEDSSEENLIYFRRLVKWMEIQVINLGETEIKVLENGHVSPVSRGFSYDEGGNTPLGKPKYAELIKTPVDLARYQSERFHQEDLILTNTLRGANFLFGKESLYITYEGEMRKILSEKPQNNKLSVGQIRSLDNMKGHLIQFRPEINSGKEKTPLFNVKTELYRLPNFLISTLVDFYDLKGITTWDKIDALLAKKIINPAGASILKNLLDQIMNLRIRCHLHYCKECDDVFHPELIRREKDDPQLRGVFILSTNDVKIISDAYLVLYPLHDVFNSVVEAKSFKKLVNAKFRGESFIALAQNETQKLEYIEAVELYKIAIALDLDDLNTKFSLIEILFYLEDPLKLDELEEYIDKTLNLAKKQRNNEQIIRATNNKVKLLCLLNKNKEAQTLIQESVDNARKSESKHLVESLNCLGMVQRASNELDAAIKSLEEAMGLASKLQDKEGEVEGLFQFGLIRVKQNNRERGINDLEKALSIHQKKEPNIAKFSGLRQHPVTAKILTHLAGIYIDINNPKLGIKLYVKAIGIYSVYLPYKHLVIQNIYKTVKPIYEKAMGLELEKEFLNRDCENFVSCCRSLEMIHQTLSELSLG